MHPTKTEVHDFTDFKSAMEYLAKTYSETPEKMKAFHDLTFNGICKIGNHLIIWDEFHILQD